MKSNVMDKFNPLLVAPRPHRPFYFNHLMAIQMSGGGANVAYGPRYPSR